MLVFHWVGRVTRVRRRADEVLSLSRPAGIVYEMEATEKPVSRSAISWGRIALLVSVTLMLAKMGVYIITGSMAVLSDAIESVVNIATSSFALYAVWVASQPRDRNHPYGHGRIEYLAEAGEGIAIFVAGAAILVVSFSRGPDTEGMSLTPLGVALVGGIAVLTFVAGTLIRRAGVRLGSPTLRADGEHIRADAITTVGAFIGVLLVYLTGIGWIDMLVAVILGFWLTYIGGKLLFRASRQLMDRADPELLDEIAETLTAIREPGWVAPHLARVHHLGQEIHVDMHLVFPRFWSLERAHDASEIVEAALVERYGEKTDLMLHMEACTPISCSYCDVSDCPIRSASFEGLAPWTGEYISAPLRHGRVFPEA